MTKIQNDNISSDLLNLNLEQVEVFDRDLVDSKGYPYYESAEITRASVFRNKLSGRVGNFVNGYDVNITFHGKEFVASCSCDHSRDICKHSIALLYAWIYDGTDFLNIANVLKDVNEFSKSRLIEIVTNMIRYYPNLVDVFLAKEKPDWDELDVDPESFI